MQEEERKQNSQNADQEETLSQSEFGFVHKFFIPEVKSGSIEKEMAREQPQERNESELKFGDPSATFFLPDFFTGEI